MHDIDVSRMAAALVGVADDEIIERDARLRVAQLDAVPS